MAPSGPDARRGAVGRVVVLVVGIAGMQVDVAVRVAVARVEVVGEQLVVVPVRDPDRGPVRPHPLGMGVAGIQRELTAGIAVARVEVVGVDVHVAAVRHPDSGPVRPHAIAVTVPRPGRRGDVLVSVAGAGGQHVGEQPPRQIGHPHRGPVRPHRASLAVGRVEGEPLQRRRVRLGEHDPNRATEYLIDRRVAEVAGYLASAVRGPVDGDGVGLGVGLLGVVLGDGDGVGAHHEVHLVARRVEVRVGYWIEPDLVEDTGLDRYLVDARVNVQHVTGHRGVKADVIAGHAEATQPEVDDLQHVPARRGAVRGYDVDVDELAQPARARDVDLMALSVRVVVDADRHRG